MLGVGRLLTHRLEIVLSNLKKLIREAFREAVFKRDKHRCAFCSATQELDAHHITDRKEMPNGGYVVENGISLCPIHHKMAEVFHETGTALPMFSPEDLYRKIGSSMAIAIRESMKLGK